jgi:hypothetical protein
MARWQSFHRGAVTNGAGMNSVDAHRRKLGASVRTMLVTAPFAIVIVVDPG